MRDKPVQLDYDSSQPRQTTRSKILPNVTNDMSSVNMGAHAAFKVRDHINGGYSQSKDQQSSFASSAKMNASDNMDGSLPKYNGKMMNSIWGMYNRFSVHNIKSHIAYGNKA